MQRYARRQEKEHDHLELAVYNPVRIIWSTIMNRHRGSKEKAYKPTDAFPLRMDVVKEEEEVKKFDMKGVIQRLGKTFKKITTK
jgi:hypothetical protein